jgi:hypothetical protein
MYMGSSSKKDSVILDLHLFLRYSLGRLPYRSRPIFYLRAGMHFPLRPPCRVIPSPTFPARSHPDTGCVNACTPHATTTLIQIDVAGTSCNNENHSQLSPASSPPGLQASLKMPARHRNPGAHRVSRKSFRFSRYSIQPSSWLAGRPAAAQTRECR